MSSKHHSSLVCESSTVTNLPLSQVPVLPSKPIVVIKPVSKPLALVLNESEPCTPPNVRVNAKEKQVQSSTRPLQIAQEGKLVSFNLFMFTSLNQFLVMK